MRADDLWRSRPDGGEARAPKSPRRRARWRRWRVAAAVIALPPLLGGLLLALLWALFPFDCARLDRFPLSPRVLDREGRPIRVGVSSRDEIRIPVRLEEVSPWLARATVAVEDHRFFEHPGVDPLAIARASAQNLARLEVHSGASTLTMQLVRILKPRPRTLLSKAIEAFRALQITAERGKDEVLEAYLDLAPYGGNLRGAEAAAWRYFGKRARELTLAEAALLAGLPQSPSRLRPDRHRGRALRRREVVLDAMLREGVIDEAQRARASAERPLAGAHPWPFEAPHFARLALREAWRAGGAGAAVRSTLDPDRQRAARARLREGLRDVALPGGPVTGAVVVIEVATSAVRAYVGSPDFFDVARRGQVDGARALRSPGSALKPFLYALAFDTGVASPTSRLYDVPTRYGGYEPENFSRRHRGPVCASTALSLSLNVPAVKLLDRVGVEKFASRLARLGVLSPGAPRSRGLSLALGGCEVRLLDLANAYAALVRLGQWRPWRVIEPPSPPGGSAPGAGASGGSRERVFSEGASRLVLEALSGPLHLRRVLGRWPRSDGPAMGYKTGTSFGQRDAWTVAFDRQWVVGVWVGSPDGSSRPGLVGARVAAPLALGLLEEISARAPARWPPTDGIVEREVCALTGWPRGPWCPETRSAPFPAGAPLPPPCRVHRRIRVDPVTGCEVCAACRRGRAAEWRVVAAWPPEVAEWRRAEGFRPSRPPHDPSCPRVAEGPGPRITSPADGSEYRWLARPGFAQRVRLEAAAGPDARRLWWFADGERLAETEVGGRASWRLSPGTHEIRCVDDRGRVARSVVRVERPSGAVLASRASAPPIIAPRRRAR